MVMVIWTYLLPINYTFKDDYGVGEGMGSLGPVFVFLNKVGKAKKKKKKDDYNSKFYYVYFTTIFKKKKKKSEYWDLDIGFEDVKVTVNLEKNCG